MDLQVRPHHTRQLSSRHSCGETRASSVRAGKGVASSHTPVTALGSVRRSQPRHQFSRAPAIRDAGVRFDSARRARSPPPQISAAVTAAGGARALPKRAPCGQPPAGPAPSLGEWRFRAPAQPGRALRATQTPLRQPGGRGALEDPPSRAVRASMRTIACMYEGMRVTAWAETATFRNSRAGPNARTRRWQKAAILDTLAR
eukprot:scaffold1938_cov399-Prasinococcus_capsulatus_cf.AAC.15